MRRLGYIRTSTNKQLIDRQILALKNECDEIFIEDGVSAVKKQRPVYQQMMNKLKSGDVMVVLSLDRAFRSVLDALSELEKLHQRNVQFKSLTQDFDTTTPEGKLLYTIAAALGEWERQILSKRTKEGLEAAKKRGKKLGRPPKLSNSKIEEIQDKLSIHGFSEICSIADELSIHPRTIRRALKKDYVNK